MMGVSHLVCGPAHVVALGLPDAVSGTFPHSAAEISRFDPTTSRGLLKSVTVDLKGGSVGKRGMTWLLANAKEALGESSCRGLR